MRLRILICLLLIMLGITCGIFGYLRAPAEVTGPTVAFQSYSNTPSGQMFAVVAITNNDSCSITIQDGFTAYHSVNQPGIGVWSSITNHTLPLRIHASCLLRFPPITAGGGWASMRLATHQRRGCSPRPVVSAYDFSSRRLSATVGAVSRFQNDATFPERRKRCRF
jgi:hypothetical protein